MSRSVLALNWQALAERHATLQDMLATASLDSARRAELQKEYSTLSSLLQKQEELTRLRQQIEQLREEFSSITDLELRSLYEYECQELESQETELLQALEDSLFPPDPLDSHSAFVEIRAGTGGQEAALFAADLARMYTNYALIKGWRCAIVDMSQTDLKGYREVTLSIEGKGVYGALKFESGVHRVQRVPQTETQGRIHTSTATVAVFPEIQEGGAISINPNDLRIDTYRAGGAGGQHVNMTDSAIRITHLPTGIVVQCQDERSQHKNKAKAMKMLLSRLMAAQQEKQQQEMAQKRKELVGSGERAEKVRTYNFPQNRVTDHQVDVTLKNLDMVIEGQLQEIVTALQERERQQRRERGAAVLLGDA